jgi:photosystem II stability/assembly factor-like uncharacterized protein
MTLLLVGITLTASLINASALVKSSAYTPTSKPPSMLSSTTSATWPLSLPLSGTWEQQAPYPTRFAINGVDMVTPTEAWAVAYTDILHTTDAGVTWEKQPRPGTNNLYSVNFFDNQHGIAMGNTVLYTTNGGDTWNQGSGAAGYDVEMVNANLAFITDHRSAGYSRSTNGGATWTFRTMPSNITTIQSFDSLNLVAASPSGVYHSYDGGLNWSFIAGQGGEFVSTYFVNHNQGWIVYGDSASRTTDGGATWQIQTLPGGTWIYDMMFSDENNGWGVGDNLVRTTNGGATWQEVVLPPESLPLWDVDFVDAQHGIAGGDSFLNTESVILTSSDGGANWATRTNGSINDVLDMVALDHNHAWATSDYGGKISRTTDGGATWLVAEPGDQYEVLGGIDMVGVLNGWAVGYDTTFLDGRIYHTSDGGATWQQQWDPDSHYLQDVDALDAQTAIVVGGYSGTGSIMRRTTDGGNTWHNLNVPIGAFFYNVFFVDSQVGWMVGGNGVIVKTTDGGNTWVVQPNPAQYTLTTIHFSDGNVGWAGGSYGTLVHTTNGGATWTLQDPQIPSYTHVLDISSTGPLNGWIAGYGGGADSDPYVKYTTNGGATWIEYTPAVGPYDAFSALAFLDDDYGWAAGAGGIFLHRINDSQPTNTPVPGTPTATPITNAALIGHVTWQGHPAQPNPLQQLPVTLTLKLGTSEYNYSGTTNGNGTFAMPVGSVPGGTYNWRAKGPQFLANSGTVTLSGAPTTNVEMGFMRTADANNDNVVNAVDFNILKLTFGKSIGVLGYDERADFTGDQAVNVTDFNLLKVNFGQGGSPPIIPGR